MTQNSNPMQVASNPCLDIRPFTAAVPENRVPPIASAPVEKEVPVWRRFLNPMQVDGFF